jgi:parallel beta-helix repeat protein
MQAKYSFKVDIFSLGCITFMMLTRNMSRNIAWEINGCGQERTFDQLRSEIENTKQNYDNEFLQLVLSMLCKDPNDRPTAKEIKEYCHRKIVETEPPAEAEDSLKTLPQQPPNKLSAPTTLSIRERKESLLKQGLKVLPSEIQPRSNGRKSSVAASSGFAMLSVATNSSDSERFPLRSPRTISPGRSSVDSTESGTPTPKSSSLRSAESPPSSTETPPSPSHYLTSDPVTLKVAQRKKSLILDLFYSKKKEDNTFKSLEEAILNSSLYINSSSVTIQIDAGTFTLKSNAYVLSKSNILIQGIPKKTVVEGEKLLIDKTGVVIRDIHFVNKNTLKPFILEVSNSDAVIENCIIEGRLLIIGCGGNAPTVRNCEIMNNRKCYGTDTSGHDTMLEDALIVSGSCPHVIGNRIHDNMSNGIGIYMKGGGFYTDNVICNHLKDESIGFSICEDSNPVLKNNIIHGNVNGVYVSNSRSILIENCIHSNKRGISLNCSSTIIENNQIYCHETVAIYAGNGSSAKLSSNVLRANNGVALFLDNSQGEIENNQIEDNYDDNVAAICVLGSRASITMRCNQICSNAGGGVLLLNSTAIIDNNIFRENSAYSVKSHSGQSKILENEILDQSGPGIVLCRAKPQTILAKNYFNGLLDSQYPALTVCDDSNGVQILSNKFSASRGSGIVICQNSIVTKFIDNEFEDLGDKALYIYSNQGAVVSVDPSLEEEYLTLSEEEILLQYNGFQNQSTDIVIIADNNETSEII